MSTPLTSLPISVNIDYNLRTITVSAQDIEVSAPSFSQAMDELLLKLEEVHNNLQGVEDDLLTADGLNFRDTVLDFGM